MNVRDVLVRSTRELALVTVVCSQLALTPCRAQAPVDDATRAAARQLGEAGIEAFRANDFATAEAKLDKAYRLYAVPTLGLWSGRARVKLNKWVEAAERYRETARLAPEPGEAAAQSQARRDASTELNQLLPRIPSITIQIESADPATVTVKLGDAEIPAELIGISRPTNPGIYEVVGVRGSERYVSQIVLQEAEHKPVLFRFKELPPSAAPLATASTPQAPAPATPPTAGPQPTAPPADLAHPPPSAAESAKLDPAQTKAGGASSLVPIGWTSLGVGAAGLAVSGALALVANGKLDDCPDHVCPDTETADSYRGLRTASSIAFYAGAGLAVLGLVLVVAAPGRADSATQEHASLRVGLGSIELRKEF